MLLLTPDQPKFKFNITVNHHSSFQLLFENKMNFTNSSFIMLLMLYKEKLVNDITVIHYQYKI